MHPYQTLDEKFFWATGVANRNMFGIEGLWDPKFRITNKSRIVTFGSCFSQHFGRSLRSHGFNWFIAEKGPVGLSEESAKEFNYGVFSARTGNIYTASLLRQWVDWATGATPVPDEVWEKDGRFYDPFRPRIEPNGFASAEEMLKSRAATVEAFRTCITDGHVLVFTLGLTESWFNIEHGYEYPMCPGTAAGDFDAEKHRHLNQDFRFIRQSLAEAVRRIKKVNPKIKFLFTVSPQPLTATLTGDHVLVAAVESKSVLRSVAGSMKQFPFVDYFPSYEMINAAPYRGVFFQPNQRSVSPAGVEFVMKNFWQCLNAKYPSADGAVTSSKAVARQERRKSRPDPVEARATEDVVCEEELLNAFAKA